MRDLNEYKAEIFRRSEERIKQRKKKRRVILSLCASLCLVFVIGCTALPYVIGPTADGIPEIRDDADGASVIEDEVQSYICVDVSGGEGKQKQLRISEPERITALSESIRSAYADRYLYYDITERAESVPDCEWSEEQKNEGYAVSETYTIVFTAPDGYKKTLVLEGNTLTDSETDMSVELKEERLAELKELLGLTD